MTPLLIEIQNRIQKVSDSKFTTVLLNQYRTEKTVMVGMQIMRES